MAAMKASKFTESQSAFVLKQAEEGTAVAEICRKAGISQATYFNMFGIKILRDLSLKRSEIKPRIE